MTKAGGSPGLRRNGWSLWLGWVLANSLAETVGLGVSFGMGAGLFQYLQAPGIITALATTGAAVLSGTLIEGTAVGTAPWLVLRRRIPNMHWHAWTLATAAGALVAWTLGMLPGTLMGAQSAGPAPAEPPDSIVYVLAAVMGLVGGTILGTPQWIVLRRHIRRAGVWVPANALAWVPGMVLAFVAADVLFSSDIGLMSILVAVFILVLIGAVVGAIHGAVLVWLLGSNNRKGGTVIRQPESMRNQ